MDPNATLASLEARIQEARDRARLAGTNLPQRFGEAARKAGCQILEANDSVEAGRLIADLARREAVRLIQAPSVELLERLGLTDLTHGLELCLSGPDPEKLLSSGMGIAEAVFGIAETGSLLIHLDEVDPRLVSMLPPIFVATLRCQDLVETLEDGLLITRHRILSAQARGRPSYLTWVTGPSRTADIERVLTIGVHGPKEMVIVLISS